jgi:hypothetical protein
MMVRREILSRASVTDRASAAAPEPCWHPSADLNRKLACD